MASVLRLKSKGTEVQTLQSLLNFALKSKRIAEDGDFGLKTEKAVKEFQHLKGLKADGVVGPKTWDSLRGVGTAARAVKSSPPSPAGGLLPDTSAHSEAEKYDLYHAYLDATGIHATTALRELESGLRVILGLRVATSTRVNQGAGEYDDRIVVLWRDKAVKRCKEFRATVDPSSDFEEGFDRRKYAKKYESQGSDADGDGRKDLGRLPAGAYRFEKSYSDKGGKDAKKVNNVLRPTKSLNSERDTNHDGVFDYRDKVTDTSKLSSGQTVLFHRGYKTMTGSAGCQTMPPAIFKDFWQTLGTQEQFEYVLINLAEYPKRPGHWGLDRPEYALA